MRRAGTALLLPLALACGGDPSAPARPFRPTTVVSPPTPFRPGCDGAAVPAARLHVGAAVEPQVAADPRDGRRAVAAWQQDRWSDGAARGVVSALTTDAGRSWTLAPARFTRCAGGTPANGGDYERASDPWVTSGPDGAFHQIALATRRAGGYAQAILASRSDDGATWSDAATLALDTDPAFAVDKPALAADPSDARLVYAAWDRLAGQGGDPARVTGPLWFTRTVDGGRSWEAPRIVHDPGPDAQTIGALLLPLPDGALLLGMTVLTGTSQPAPASATLAFARSTDRGATWSAAVAVDGIFGARARDGRAARVRSGAFLASAAVDRATGALYVAWSDARFTGGAVPAVALARSDDGGRTFSIPVQVNASPAPAFTPAVAVASDGAVAVLYYDLRDDDPDDARPLGARAWLARSGDGGRTFREEALGELFDLGDAPDAGGLFLGDYQGLAAAGERFLPVFVRAAPGRTAVETAPW